MVLYNRSSDFYSKTFEFEIGSFWGYDDRKEKAWEIAKRVCPEGWSPSNYFSSKSSFFEKDGKSFAMTQIARWHKEKEEVE